MNYIHLQLVKNLLMKRNNMNTTTDNDMPSVAQQEYAQSIANRLEIEIDENILINKSDLRDWIDEYKDLPTQKQIELAEQIAEKKGEELTDDALQDSELLSEYIDENIHLINSGFGPSTKQINFAKGIAKKLKIQISKDILENKALLKDWIDGHQKKDATGAKVKKKQLK